MFTTTISEWGASNQQLLTWLVVGSVITFAVSLITLPWLVARIPEDYFVPNKRVATQWKIRQPVIRLLVLLGKNIFGLILLLGGILMLIIPGQGILTIAMGLLLMDYPGKFRLERKLVSQPVVFNGLNWLRRKVNKPPLRI